MAAKKNPFEIFGLTPEMTGRLDDKDLFAIVKSMYRTLAKVYHPDTKAGRAGRAGSKDEALAVELNLAFEKLNLEKDSESFRHHRRLYSARRKSSLRKKISALRGEMQAMEDKQASLADGFMDYLLRGMASAGNGRDFCGMLLNPTNLRLGLNDVAINQNVRSSSWHIGSNYKEITFDALGGMLYRPVGRSKAFPINYIHLLGTIDVGAVDLVSLMDRVPPREGFFKYPALDSRYGIDGAKVEVLNTITLEKFKKHCLPLLRPELKEQAYLFSANRPLLEQEGRISIEGSIVKMSGL